jgi:hypothetical protein
MKNISLSDKPLAHHMESLESKLDRLSLEQRKEVEEFVDFLFYRSGNTCEFPGTTEVPMVFKKTAPPSLVAQEPAHTPYNFPIKDDDMIPGEILSDPVQTKQGTLFNGISSAGDDRITRDYLDYGQYNQTPSPATAAVKNVKEKLQKRAENEKSRVSLDWID